MLEFAPQKTVRVIRFLNNPSDDGTYYCKAFIYDAVDGTLLDSFALTDDGDKTFSKLWQTPADPTGEGRQLIVSIVCYDDSGYTNVSPVYGTEKDSWLIQARVQNYGGGGGIDYTEVAKVIRALLKEAKGEEKELDLSPVFDALDGTETRLISRMERMTPEEREEFDFTKIEDIFKKAIKDLKETAEGVENLIDTFKDVYGEALGSIAENHQKFGTESQEKLAHSMKEFIEEVRSELDKGGKSLSEAVKKVSDDFMANPITISLAPQGEMKAQVGRDKKEEKPLRPLQQLNRR